MIAKRCTSHLHTLTDTALATSLCILICLIGNVQSNPPPQGSDPTTYPITSTAIAESETTAGSMHQNKLFTDLDHVPTYPAVNVNHDSTWWTRHTCVITDRFILHRNTLDSTAHRTPVEQDLAHPSAIVVSMPL